MKHRLVALLAEVDCLLADDTTDLDALADRLSTEISFIAHERLCHLLVTLFFGFLAVGGTAVFLYVPSLILGALVLLFWGLSIPYVFHYYTLENGIQTLYTRYDAVRRGKETKKHAQNRT